MILLIDNYDSFVHNLARYLQRLGEETRVFRNDAITVRQVRELRPAAVVLSPGPCTPNEAGVSLQLVRELAGETPLLGVCLGHQTIAAAFGAAIVRAAEPMHGRTSHVFHDGRGLFRDVPSPLMPPPGCVAEPHMYKLRIGVRYCAQPGAGRRKKSCSRVSSP